MRRRYATADVFTDRLFGGNPLAAVFDAAGLSGKQMQSIASEFNYIATTFLLPPQERGSVARVRIFTPFREIPFAGHPNLGTAYLLALEAQRRGEALPEEYILEGATGPVNVKLLKEQGKILGAELTAPHSLKRRAQAVDEEAAACLGLDPSEISTQVHPPQVISVGVPFLVAEVKTRHALRGAHANKRVYSTLFPLDGAQSVFAYTRDVAPEDKALGCDLEARMFTWRAVEDPASGSATAGVAALLAVEEESDSLTLKIRQGVDLGRPSLLQATAFRGADGAMHARVGGCCIPALEGYLELPSGE